MEVSEKMSENGLEETRSLSNLTQADNEEIKSLEKSNDRDTTETRSSHEETQGHQGVDKGNNNLTVDNGKSKVVASGEDDEDDGKRVVKRTKYSEDGGEPPKQQPNFTFRLFGFEISCYREEESDGPKHGEGSSRTNPGPAGADGGEPPIQQP